MRFTKTVDVDFDLDLDDVLDWIDSASDRERDLAVERIKGQRSTIFADAPWESCVTPREVRLVRIASKPHPTETLAIVSTCGRFCAHPRDPTAWSRGVINWPQEWSVTHVRTGLATGSGMSARNALSMLDELSVLAFEDFGDFDDAGVITDSAKQAITPVARKYQFAR